MLEVVMPTAKEPLEDILAIQLLWMEDWLEEQREFGGAVEPMFGQWLYRRGSELSVKPFVIRDEEFFVEDIMGTLPEMEYKLVQTAEYMEDETFGYPFEGKGLLDHSLAGYEAFEVKAFDDYWFELCEGVIPQPEGFDEGMLYELAA